jgi:hypothetical protein
MPPKLGRVRLVMSTAALPSDACIFHSYTTVSELDDSDEVLRFVIGWAINRRL